MNTIEVIVEIVKIILAVGAAAFTYFRFFREGTHKQRIQFDIEFCDLGVKNEQRIVEVTVLAENKGNVEQRFEEIRLQLRGLDLDAELNYLPGYAPRLRFPLQAEKASLIPDKYGYFFVRPKVKQRFPLVTQIPANWSHMLARATFKYKGTYDIHTAEKAFQIKMND